MQVASANAQSEVAVNTATAPLQKQYNATIDYFRFVAVMIIVLFHAKAPFGQFGPTAVSFFIVAMVFFSMRPKESQTFPQLVASRAHRLLIPWLVWMAIYAAAKTGQSVVAGEDPVAELIAWLPPKGTTGQLWFLPFAFLASLFLARFSFLLHDAASTHIGMAMLGFFSAIITVFSIAAWSFFGGQWLGVLIYIVYLPSLCFGILLTVARDGISRTIVAVGAVAIGAILALSGGDMTQQLLVGIPAALLALVLHLPETRLARRLGKMSMGIYLTHLLVIAALPRVTGIEPSTILGGVLCCLGACALTLAIDATPLRRFI